ncbi:probable NADH dehydrogenase [ubiquinone] 1 alpha subcomplex subunit 12 [Daktulosphaira vitifoliae]|uniref:probable NADH dehydrogenase [ubiquinone] 1 alpha subcomplex subunit 12 n=1 Tax=Daktulosphaira vitifoliae TaxID=58002 RepID=UPI0021AAF952|nr:probable NADH dehydrogenase [ubiquinone] 1 alpha subcomplex subunit 12 [Daktulosphaira vitifoliae]
MSKIFPFNKITTGLNIIKANGGPLAAFKKLFRQDELKIGTLVGTDEMGNRYYENNLYFYGRNRWVEYNEKVFLDYDASQIPAEWYGWLHYKTDLLPYNDPSRPKYSWMAKHTENLTGTSGQYVPYSSVRPKIEAWVPSKKC